MGASPTDPDLRLVRALQRGDQSALNELMRKYREPLSRFIWRYTGDEETARDLLQETFVRVYFGIGRFVPSAKFATWLYSIATNLCRDHARSKAGRQARATRSLDADGAPHEFAAREREAGAYVESRERLAEVERAIRELPHDLRTAPLLFAVEGHSQDECAELLGISAKAVETRVYRARKLLEKRLQRD